MQPDGVRDLRVLVLVFVFVFDSIACESTPILLYHSVGEPFPEDRWVSPDQFRAQMQHLQANGYSILTARELDEIEQGTRPSPPQPIVLTFDDGYRNFLVHAYPILDELQIAATLFVPTERIHDSVPLVLGVEYLTWPEVRALDASGIDIESHSKTHPRMRDLSASEAEDELRGSKLTLQGRLGHEITVFAYPGGSVSPALETMAERAGYTSAHSVSAGLNSRFARQRISIHSGVELDTFDRMIRGTWWGESSGER